MASDSGVGSVVIVVVQPRGVGGGAFGFAGVGAGVGPLGGQGSVETFDLPVRLRPIRLGLLVLDPGLGQCLGERVGSSPA